MNNPQLSTQQQAISLVEFNARIKRLLNNPLVSGCWVVAETSDVRLSGGHCYLELIQKDAETGRTLAKVRACIWQYQYRSINAQFKAVTGQALASNMKVMVQVNVNYHEQYGMSVVISAINPEFTLGDMARRRQEIINRLTQEGIINQNKTVPFPLLPRRIAIVSAAGAAGYGDFMKKITENPYGFTFYTALFAATMQGVNTVPTVLAALNRVEQHLEHFDCVVIIRGGGSTDDLNSFDDYDLARRVALFPLPVVVGIGHERDVSILDYVAGVRALTPTAAAEYLIQCDINVLAHLNDLSNAVVRTAQEYVARAKEQLAYYSGNIPLKVVGRLKDEQGALQRKADAVQHATGQIFSKEKMRLEHLQEMLQSLSPIKVLARGYTLSMSEGKIITDPDQLAPGSRLTTHFATGKVVSEVKLTTKTKN